MTYFTVHTVICAFVSSTNIYWAPTMHKKKISLFQIWIFNPKWKSGSYVDKYYSKVQSPGSRVAPCFLAVNHSSRKQEKTWKAVVLKVWPLNRQQQQHLARNANSRAAPDLGIRSCRNRAGRSCFNRPSKWFWWHWSLRATVANQPWTLRKMDWVGNIF